MLATNRRSSAHFAMGNGTARVASLTARLCTSLFPGPSRHIGLRMQSHLGWISPSCVGKRLKSEAFRRPLVGHPLPAIYSADLSPLNRIKGEKGAPLIKLLTVFRGGLTKQTGGFKGDICKTGLDQVKPAPRRQGARAAELRC